MSRVTFTDWFSSIRTYPFANLLVDPCLVQVTDHCISMPSVVYSQMCLIDISCYLDHFLKVSLDLWTLLMHSYGGIEPIIWAIESFPPLPVTLVEHM